MPTLETIKTKYRDNRIKNRAERNRRYRLFTWEYLYGTKQWRHLSDKYRREHPICELCCKKSPPIIRAARDVHHIIPFSTGKTDEEMWNLLLDENNLVALCVDCHAEIHNKLRKNNKFNTHEKK